MENKRRADRAEYSPRTRSKRIKRIARAAVVAFLSLYAFYLIAMNAMLATPLLSKALHGDPVDVTYSSAWSVLPGRIHAKDLSIRSSDSNVEWLLRLDEVTFDVSFLPLVQRRFEASHVRGHGISMLGRRKLDALPYEADEVADLPQIPGFPAFSVRPCGPPHPERWDDSRYELWTGHLEDVIAEDVREVWIDKVRFAGSARVEGRFYLKPLRAVEVGPAHVDVHHGIGGLGLRTLLASSVAGTVDLRIDRFDPREIMDQVPDKSLVRLITLGTELQGRLADLSTLPIEPLFPVYVAGIIDAPRVALRIDRGRLMAGTRVDLESQRTMTFAKANASGTLASFTAVTEVVRDAAAAAAGGRDKLLVHAEARELLLARADGRGIVNMPLAHVEGDARELDLAAPILLADAHATLDVPRVSLPDASVLNLYIPEETTPVTIVDGEADARFQLDAWRADNHLSGVGELHANQLDVRIAKMRARGAFDVAGSFGAFRPDQNRLENATLNVVVSHVALSSDRAPDNTMTTVKNIVANATSERVNLDDPLESLEVSFRMHDADITDRMLLREYLPKGSKLQLIAGRSRVEGEGNVTIEKHLGRGELHARSRGLAMSLGDMTIVAGVEAHARVHDWRWEVGDLAIDHAAVDIRHLTMTKNQSQGQALALASIDAIHIAANSPAFKFSDPFAGVNLEGSVKGGVVHNPVSVNAFLPDAAVYGLATEDFGDPAKAISGAFEADARLSIVNHVAKGHVKAAAQHMGVRAKPITVVGEASAEADVERWDMEASIISLGASSRATITNARGRVGKNGERELGAKKIELTGQTKDLDIAHPSLRGVDGRFVLQDAELPDARVLQELLPPGEALKIQSGSAHASSQIDMSASKRTASGEIAIEVVKAGVAFHETQLSGDFGIRVPVRGFDPDTSTIDISGTHIALRDVEVSNAAAETTRWKSDIWLNDATFRFDGPDRDPGGPRLDGMVRLQADNARPILGVLLRKSLPTFAVNLIDMPQLELRARLHFAPNILLISDIYGRGGDIALRGSYGVFGDEPAGAFVVSKGPVALGVRLAKDGTHPRLFRLDTWIAEEESIVKAKANAAAATLNARAKETETEKAKAKTAEKPAP